MNSFFRKSIYVFVKTLFDDDHIFIGKLSEERLWKEIQNTLKQIPPLYRVIFYLSFILLSIVQPPFSFFRFFYSLPLESRREWIASWAHSRWFWKRSVFIGTKLLVLSSCFQDFNLMHHTPYPLSIQTRQSGKCVKVSYNVHD